MSDLVSVVTPERLNGLEAAMLAEPQVDCSIEHVFLPGLYIRMGLMPAGTVVLGHAWKAPNMNVMISGEAYVQTGGNWKRLVAPQTFVAPAGRKLFYAVTDVRWANVVVTDLTDVARIEADLVETTETWRAAQEAACLSHQQ